MYIKSSCQWAFFPSLFSEINHYFTELYPSCWHQKHLKLCCPRRYVGKCVITCHHSPLHLFNTNTSVNLNWKNRLEEETALSIPASVVSVVAGLSPLCFSLRPFCSLHMPHLSFFFQPPPPSSVRERQSLAGTAGCPGNALCHRSGLEQELAYPCQSAGRIWAMPCVNRLSDFHSDGSGISPTPPLWKSDPGQPLSESPQSPPLFSHFLS